MRPCCPLNQTWTPSTGIKDSTICSNPIIRSRNPSPLHFFHATAHTSFQALPDASPAPKLCSQNSLSWKGSWQTLIFTCLNSLHFPRLDAKTPPFQITPSERVSLSKVVWPQAQQRNSTDWLPFSLLQLAQSGRFHCFNLRPIRRKQILSVTGHGATGMVTRV